MKKTICSLSLILALFYSPGSADEYRAKTGAIRVEITKFRNNSGEVRVNLYNTGLGFPSHPEKAFMSVIKKIENNAAAAEFKDLPFGDYAIAVLHDENGNRKMDFNWLMIPKEGVGSSNNPKMFLGPPGFEESKFRLDSGDITVKINMRY